MLPDSLYWENIKEDDDLPSLVKDVTATTVIYGAIAARDFMPAHHDRDFAQRCGMKDIYMNSPVTTGWASKYLTDWTGPSGELKRISLRFGSPCFPGDTLTWRGRVARKYINGEQHLVDVEYSATVLETGHCTGTATIRLPSIASAHSEPV
jgi:acyl dehydratase